jgi:hypothetical protein
MDAFRLVGRHPESLASGVIVSPGEKVELKTDEQKDEHNKRLIEDGVLRPIKKAKPAKTNGGDD